MPQRWQGEGRQPTSSHPCYAPAGPAPAHAVVSLHTFKHPQLLHFVAVFCLFPQRSTAGWGTCCSTSWNHRLCG